MKTTFDPGMLDRDIEVVPRKDSGAALLKAFDKRHTHYAVVLDEPQAREFGLVVGRGRLYADIIDRAGLNRPQREKWAQYLIDDPRNLAGLVARSLLGKIPGHSLDLPLTVNTLDIETRRAVDEYLTKWLHEFDQQRGLRAVIVDINAKQKGLPDPPLIAMSGNKVVGVFSPNARTHDVEFMLARVVKASQGQKAKPPLATSMPASMPAPKPTPSVIAPHVPAPQVPSSPVSAPQPSPLEVSMPDRASPPGGGGEPPPAFIAHPRLDTPEVVFPGKEFSFTVGYSDRPDPEADSTQGFDLPDPVEGDTMLVMASAEGARVLEPWSVRLPLDMAQSHEFKAIVDPGAQRVRLRAKYFFRSRPVGHIVKSVAVEGFPLVRGPAHGFDNEVIAKFAPQLSNYADIAPIDIVLMVQKRRDGQVAWHALVTSEDQVYGEYLKDLQDTQVFARGLAGLRKQGDRGRGPRDELEYHAQLIAGEIPQQILRQVLAPALRAGTPNILLMTDEPYVPWELALLGRPHIEEPAFFGQVARIGRWWSADSLGGPHSSRAIKAISAVAAKEYREVSGVRTLENAHKERQWILRQGLRDEVRDVEAVKPTVDQWLSTKPQPEGHLAHIALHGFSDTIDQSHGLILGDGEVLTPGSLVGRFFPGDKPRFDMVFMNACQVGTAGERLGRIGGFPGAVLRGGAAAFIGPLWEVDDGVAREVAENFYTRVLQQGMEVAEALREIRSLPELSDSITPWAYLYYGHPNLRLT